MSRDGERLSASVWAETGVKKGHWSLGAIYREEQHLRFSKDTAELFYSIETNQDLNTGRHYEIDLNTYRFRGHGIRVARHMTPSKNVKLTLGTSLFQASNLLDGDLQGSATANSDDEYQYQFGIDYHYNKDLIFERRGTSSPKGLGVALDMSLTWQPSERVKLSAEVTDLIGTIRWRDAPYTKANTNPRTSIIDETGLSQVNPVLSGIEGTDSSHTQALKPSADFSGLYKLRNTAYTASTKLKYTNDLTLFAVGGLKQISGSTVGLHYWPQVGVLEAHYQGKQLGISLGADSLNLSKSHAIWLSLTYH